jgi:ribosomal protein S18 acetylase RimI-like enzyme
MPEVQRKGWGRKLIGLAVDYLKERGYRNLFVGIDPKNHEGRKFYQAIGFERFKVDSGAEYWLLDFEKWGKKSA